MIRVARWLGVAQAAFARDYREGTALVRACVLPSWMFFRLFFLIAHGLVRMRHAA